jgi:hypothetical protein
VVNGGHFKNPTCELSRKDSIKLRYQRVKSRQIHTRSEVNNIFRDCGESRIDWNRDIVWGV